MFKCELRFRFNRFKASDKIKENTYVESVSIKRELPDVVKISIKERTIKYLIEYASGYAYVSSQGYIIDISDEKKEVPILQGYSTDISEIKLGNRLNTEDERYGFNIQVKREKKQSKTLLRLQFDKKYTEKIENFEN